MILMNSELNQYQPFKIFVCVKRHTLLLIFLKIKHPVSSDSD